MRISDRFKYLEQWLHTELLSHLVLKHDPIIRDVSTIKCNAGHRTRFMMAPPDKDINHGWGPLIGNDYQTATLQFRYFSDAPLTPFEHFVNNLAGG